MSNGREGAFKIAVRPVDAYWRTLGSAVGLGCVFVVLSSGLTPAVSAEAPSIEDILEQQNASLARIQSFSYRVDYNVDADFEKAAQLSSDKPIAKPFGTVYRKHAGGKEYFVHEMYQNITQPDGSENTCYSVRRGIANEHLFAHWADGDFRTKLNAFERSGIDDRPEEYRGFVQLAIWPDPLLFAFGFGPPWTFSQWYSENGGDCNFTVSEVAGKAGDALYVVSIYRKLSPDRPCQRVTISPDKGFVIERLETLDESGKCVALTETSYVEAAPGIWFPKLVNKSRRGFGGDWTDATYDFKEIVVNADIPDSQFTVAALDYPNPRAAVLRKLDGKVVAVDIEGAELVPHKRSRDRDIVDVYAAE